jgi:4'-phosphopantetheinyl transferase
VSSGEAQALLEIDGDEQKGRWSLRSLDPGRGYAGALAVEGHGWRLECWQWTMRLAQDAGL